MSDLPPGHPRAIGKYEILSILGKGGMGIVYKARDPLIDRTVAIKTIHSRELGDDERLLARLRMEARSAGRLLHPNIVTVFDFGEHENLTYLVMEHVEGANLARVINGGIELPLESKIDIVAQLCEALAYAHDLGVIHRDIKPSNVCLTRRGEPKLLDFGLARFDETRLTKTGLTSGTISYMSPERIRGESGPSDDIFAMGALAYEIFTGEPAFPGDTYVEVVTKIIGGEYPIPPSRVANLPQDLDVIIARATATEKSQRYQSAADFARALRDFRHSATVQRRVASAGSAASVENAMKTIAINFSVENPYSAPDIDAPTADISSKDLIPAAAVPVSSQGQPSAPTFGPEHFAPTQAIVAPVFTEGHSAGGDSLARTVVGRAAPAPAASTPPESGIRSVAKTVVGSIFRRRDIAAEDVHGLATAKHGIAEVEVETPKPFMFAWIVAFALVIAAVPLTGATFGVAALIVLAAVAAVLWYFAVRAGKSATLPMVMGAALAVRLLIVLQAPVAAVEVADYFRTGAAVAAGANPYITSTEVAASALPLSVMPPYTALLFALMAAAGSNLLLWRAVVLVADLAVVALLWEEPRPRRALAYALFPLALIEGAWFGAVEPVAAALLLGALIALRRQRDSLAASAATLAAGVSVLAIAALPILYSAAWKMFRFIGAALAIIAIPALAFDGVRAWVLPLTQKLAASPLLSAGRDVLGEMSAALNLGENINALLNLLGQRVGNPARSGTVSDAQIGMLMLVAAVIVAITVVAQRSRDTDAAVANAIGFALLLSMTTSPASWLLVVPFAIAGNRQFWVFAALASPILYLNGTGELNYLVYGGSLLVATVVWIGFKLQQMAGERLATAPAAVPS